MSGALAGLAAAGALTIALCERARALASPATTEVRESAARDRGRAAPASEGTETQREQRASGEQASDGSVSVRGGTFRMGIAADSIPELRRRYEVTFPGVFENEAPAHTVTLGDFRLDRHEVTNAEFAEFVAEQPEWGRAALAPDRHNGRYLEHWKDGHDPAGAGDHPVVFVTWHAAMAFCQWQGGRLPTEAEWEYAARAGGDAEFPWGDEPPPPERANYAASGHRGTRPVGSYPPNPFGLYDLAGNVWEFLLDEDGAYSKGAQQDPVAGGPVAPQAVGGVQGRRIVRGASFGGGTVNLRTRWRDSHPVTNAVEFVGFRCAYPARQP